MRISIALTNDELIDILNQRRQLPVPADYEVFKIEHFQDEPSFNLILSEENEIE